MPLPLVNGRMARGWSMQVRPAGAALVTMSLPRPQRQLKDGPRAPERRLGTTMMRRMIGRDKGFRCDGLVAGVEVLVTSLGDDRGGYFNQDEHVLPTVGPLRRLGFLPPSPRRRFFIRRTP